MSNPEKQTQEFRMVPETDSRVSEIRKFRPDQTSESFGGWVIKEYSSLDKLVTDSNQEIKDEKAQLEIKNTHQIGTVEERQQAELQIRRQEENTRLLEASIPKWVIGQFKEMAENYVNNLTTPKSQNQAAFARRRLETVFTKVYPQYASEPDKESVNKQLLSGMQNEKVSLPTLLKIAEELQAIEQKEQQEFSEFSESCRTEFIQIVKSKVEKGELPQTALDNLHRIDEALIILTDVLKSSDNDALGTAHGESNYIRIDNVHFSEDPKGEIKNTIFHEFYHLLSGSSITIREEARDWGHYLSAFLKKTGLRLNTQGRLFLSWLNEAITEDLTLNSSDYKIDGEDTYDGSGIYVDERKEFHDLIKKGVSKQLFIDAYFENFVEDPNKKPGEKYTKLLKRVSEVLGPEELLKLNNKFFLKEVPEYFTEDELNLFTSKQDALSKSPNDNPANYYRVKFIMGHRGSEVTKDYYVRARHSNEPEEFETEQELTNRLKTQLDTLRNATGQKVIVELSPFLEII